MVSPKMACGWLCLLVTWLLASCENATPVDLATATAPQPFAPPATAASVAPAPATSRPTALAPTQVPTPVPIAPLNLPLAYSTSEGIFLWNARTAERRQIDTEPAARLSWSADGAWLAATDHPFFAIQISMVTPDSAVRRHRMESNFSFPLWSGNDGAVLALPCEGTSSRSGDFQIVDPARGLSHTAGNAEIWSWLPNVAPDLSKALITPFNTPYRPSAVILYDDWRAPLLLKDVSFPSCPDAYAWTPNSRYLAYYDGGRFWMLDLDEPKPLAKLVSGPATLEPIDVVAPAIAWSPDGTRLALALKGQVWLAPLETLTAQPIESLKGVYSSLAWAPAPLRGTPSPDGVLGRLMPYLNPADFYDAFVQVGGRPAPRIIAASTDVLAQGPFVYVDYGQRKLFVAPPPTRLNCPLFRGQRPQAPALRVSTEQTNADGQETLVVTGGWYMTGCQGTLVYRWDGNQVLLIVETSAAP